MPTQFIDTLRRAGLRITSQRVAVCEFLARAESHPTPSQVYEAVRQAHPEISQATVYNTLNMLRDLGAIVEISAGSEHTHYDPNPFPHINLICLRCSQVTDLQDNLAPDALMDSIFQTTGFRASAFQVQVTGFCPSCQQAKRQEIRSWLRAPSERQDRSATG